LELGTVAAKKRPRRLKGKKRKRQQEYQYIAANLEE
jgi:hypothetical protein